MRSSRRLLAPLGFLAALAALAGLALVGAGPAWADAAGDAASALQSSSVYVASGVDNGYGRSVQIDTSQVAAAAGDQIKIAILPAGNSTVDAAKTIYDALTPASTTVIAVFSGNKIYAGSTPGLAPDLANTRLQTIASANKAQLQAGNYTATLVSFSTTMRQIITTATSGGGNGGSGDSNTSGGSDSSNAGAWIGGIAAVAVVGGGGGYVYTKRRRAKAALAAAKANVMPYYDRLANEVNTINTLDNATARQAMADAFERYNAAGSAMATATTVQNWAVVRRTTLEGLQASQLARKELGLPPGPELPAIDQIRGDQLTDAQEVDVKGQRYQGYPQYTPGAPYFYGGGGGYPGGWYSFPFWETLLIGSMIGGGGWGWGGGGGGYGAGYDSGYQAGQDSGQNDGGSSGWGGGGDFGGGFGGGGDFGGGGGGGGSDGGSF